MFHLLHLWWTETKWVYDRLDTHAGVANRDISVAESVLHHLAVSKPPHSASSPHLGSRDDVSLEIAGKGIGHAGSVHVHSELWRDRGDPHFEWAGVHAPVQPPSNCPKAADMLHALYKEALLVPTEDPANAQVFVKYKPEEKAALIVNMIQLDHQCAYKARPFRLPTLEGLAATLRRFFGQAWAYKLDLRNYYWSIHLPLHLMNSIRVAAGSARYAIIRVPFGWHQAPSLVQHLISRVLNSIDPKSIVIIQFLDDILFVGSARTVLRAVTRRAADALVKEGYI